MLWANASSVLLLLVAALVFYSVSRRLYAAFALKRELETTLDNLETLLTASHDATARLEAAIRRAESLPAPLRRDILASIESLSDPGALADANSFSQIAAQLPQQPINVADIFQHDEKALSIARLCGQGLKPAEISSRLSLPIGEVEFLLSLRPASQA